jgi:hypothetical protein
MHCNRLKSPPGNASLFRMDTLHEIEAALDALPVPQQKELFRHLAERFKEQEELKRSLPLVPPTGNSITQQDIDDALDSD